MNYKELLNSVLLNEVLENPKSLVNIDINDIKDLFLNGGNISDFEIIVDALEEKRMKLLVNKIKEHTKCCHAFSRALVFFIFPEDRPLLMEELHHIYEWMESIPVEIMMKWGMATQSTQDLRAIVLLQ